MIYCSIGSNGSNYSVVVDLGSTQALQGCIPRIKIGSSPDWRQAINKKFGEFLVTPICFICAGRITELAFWNIKIPSKLCYDFRTPSSYQ